jgi:hypothetical protein
MMLPSASYLADGLVITSTLATELPGLACSEAASVDADGLPLIYTFTSPLPRTVIWPSGETPTLGTVRRISSADPA